MKLQSIRTFQNIPDCEYIALVFAPGAKNPLHNGRENEWADRKFVGCTGELEDLIDLIPEFQDKSIAVRVISTMTEVQEANACDARPFGMPAQTDWFQIIADSELKYKDFCGDEHPAVKINSGKTIYQPHTLVLRRVLYNQDNKQWTGSCISLEHRNNKPDVLLTVETDHSKKMMYRPSVDTADTKPVDDVKLKKKKMEF